MTRKEELKILIKDLTKEIFKEYKYICDCNDFIVNYYGEIKSKQDDLDKYIEEYRNILEYIK